MNKDKEMIKTCHQLHSHLLMNRIKTGYKKLGCSWCDEIDIILFIPLRHKKNTLILQYADPRVYEIQSCYKDDRYLIIYLLICKSLRFSALVIINC